jgi:hypothetical protein
MAGFDLRQAQRWDRTEPGVRRADARQIGGGYCGAGRSRYAVSAVGHVRGRLLKLRFSQVEES